MGRTIVKLIDVKNRKKAYYMEWSSVVDAPTTNGMTLKVFKEYFKKEYGESGMERLEKRLERVEEKGHSSLVGNETLEEFIKYNHAGINNIELSLEGILHEYCRNNINFQ